MFMIVETKKVEPSEELINYLKENVINNGHEFVSAYMYDPVTEFNIECLSKYKGTLIVVVKTSGGLNFYHRVSPDKLISLSKSFDSVSEEVTQIWTDQCIRIGKGTAPEIYAGPPRGYRKRYPHI